MKIVSIYQPNNAQCIIKGKRKQTIRHIFKR